MSKAGGSGGGETGHNLYKLLSLSFDIQIVGIDIVLIISRALWNAPAACSSQHIPIWMFWNCLSVCSFMAISHKNLECKEDTLSFSPIPFIIIIMLCYSTNTIFGDVWEKSQQRTIIWDSTMQRKAFFLRNVRFYQFMQSSSFQRSWVNHISHTLKCFRFPSTAFISALTVLPFPFKII